MSAGSPGNSKHPRANAALDPRKENILPCTAVDDDNEEVKKNNEFDQPSLDHASHRNLQSGEEETEKKRFSTQKNPVWNPMNYSVASEQARCLDERIVRPCDLWGSTKVVQRPVD